MADQIGGREFRFGGRVVVLYPLSLRQLRTMAADIQAIAKIDPNGIGDQFDAVLRIFTASAQRGDPKVTAEDVEAVADMSNMQDMIEACLSRRMVRRGEDAGPQSPRTGGVSSQALPTQLDGTSATSET